jgi:hypothetical protein
VEKDFWRWIWTSIAVVVLLVGCEHLQQLGVTCAPRAQVVACLNEAYQESLVGLGPQCSALAVWAQARGWEVEGTGPTARQAEINGKIEEALRKQQPRGD